jgi:hypothetical protein
MTLGMELDFESYGALAWRRTLEDEQYPDGEATRAGVVYSKRNDDSSPSGLSLRAGDADRRDIFCFF